MALPGSSVTSNFRHDPAPKCMQSKTLQDVGPPIDKDLAQICSGGYEYKDGAVLMEYGERVRLHIALMQSSDDMAFAFST